MVHTQSPLQKVRKTLIGDRAFYSLVFTIVVPIIIQNAITNAVNLLDNVMVGKIGTDQMTGVSIANQLIFIANLCVFGGVSGAGLFSAQYHGADNPKGVRNCFRYKMYLCVGLIVLTIAVFIAFDTPLISLYLTEGEDPTRAAATLGHALDYLHIMLLGIAPFAISQAYSSTLRETGNTALPMRAGIVAVFTNLILNFILIYGFLFIPPMGVKGAALATVISRYTELFIVVSYTHRNHDKYPFIHNAYRSPKIPLSLVKSITIKGVPLLINEFLWSLAMATLAQCYSVRGLDVVAAFNISNTVANLFSVIFHAMGSAVAIISGQLLGAGELGKAREYSWKLITASVISCLATSALLAIVAPFIPNLYNTEPEIRSLTTQLLMVCAGTNFLISYSACCFFMLRAGGKSIIAFFFDCGFYWIVSIPLALGLIHGTDMNVVSIYFLVQSTEAIKVVLGTILIKKGVWLENMVVH